VIHLPPGGTLTLECSITRMDAVPGGIFWKYGERILTPKDRNGISLVNPFTYNGLCFDKIISLYF
jgi:hypothetical protein